MKLIVGLGNPGSEYEKTRHNAGWIALDRFAEAHRAIWIEQSKFQGLVAKCTIGSDTVLLLKPTTFMNLSGESVARVSSYYKIPITDILVVQDEMDFAPGIWKFSLGGRPAGHNGLESIYESLGSSALDQLSRVRIGIGRPTNGQDSADWVLGKIDPATIQSAQNSIQGIEAWIQNGIHVAMNQWNKKDPGIPDV